jgi:hypothetical protein
MASTACGERADTVPPGGSMSATVRTHARNVTGPKPSYDDMGWQ